METRDSPKDLEKQRSSQTITKFAYMINDGIYYHLPNRRKLVLVNLSLNNNLLVDSEDNNTECHQSAVILLKIIKIIHIFIPHKCSPYHLQSSNTKINKQKY